MEKVGTYVYQFKNKISINSRLKINVNLLLFFSISRNFYF